MARSLYIYLDDSPMLDEWGEEMMESIEDFLDYTNRWLDITEESSGYYTSTKYPPRRGPSPDYLDQQADLDKRAPYRHS